MPDFELPKFVILAVMDGWGISAPGAGNATTLALTPNLKRLTAGYPHTSLDSSGEAVGLLRGEAGNTETGHINIGAGRVIYQDLSRISMSIADGTFYKNIALNDAIVHAIKNNSSLHLIGLVGAAGVHSNLDHLLALIHMANTKDLKKLFIHVITDGRDSPPTSAMIFIQRILESIAKEGVGQIASVMGRYYAMDRDYRWERTAKAYFALTKGLGNLYKTPQEAIEASYNEGKTDEFIEPCLISDAQGKPLSLISDNDSVIFYNFRIDRPRQIASAFVIPEFDEKHFKIEFDPYLEKYKKSHLLEKSATEQKLFDRGAFIKNLYFTTMTEYSKLLVDAGTKVAFPPVKVDMPLSRVISEAGLKQLHAAESEKERFVTFYFNGQEELSYQGEERLIVPSPKVATYDLKPEMSARELTDTIIAKMKDFEDFKFTIVNFANPDMVAHTGNIGAAVVACNVTDECVGKLADFSLAYNGALIITADHGNAEEMIDMHTGQVDTEHNASPVPFIVVYNKFSGNPQELQTGILADIAPTILYLLGISIPSQMTGRNLLEGLS